MAIKDQHRVTVALLVKAGSREEAEHVVHKRIDAWFLDPSEQEVIMGFGYRYGSLLHWQYVKRGEQGFDA